MTRYIITIKKDARVYMFSRYYHDDYDRVLVTDVLEALFHLHLIDEFTVKEMDGEVVAREFIVKEADDEDQDLFLKQ